MELSTSVGGRIDLQTVHFCWVKRRTKDPGKRAKVQAETCWASLWSIEEKTICQKTANLAELQKKPKWTFEWTIT